MLLKPRKKVGNTKRNVVIKGTLFFSLFFFVSCIGKPYSYQCVTKETDKMHSKKEAMSNSIVSSWWTEGVFQWARN